MEIDLLTYRQLDKVQRLCAEYEFSDYRPYRFLTNDQLVRYLCAQIRSFAKDKNTQVFFAKDNNEVTALISWHFLPWDTQVLGTNVAKIGYFMGNGVDGIKEKLLSRVFELCRKKNISHLSCRLDSGDISDIHLLEKKGFKIMDTLVTYAFNRYRHKVPPIRELYKVRNFRRGDLISLTSIARNSFSKDRFHLDTHFSPRRADNLFVNWIKNSCRDLRLNRVFVCERGSGVVGFLTFRLDDILETVSGYRIAGHGLSAVSPETKGAYPGLVKSAVQEIVRHYHCLEFDTQLNNYEVIRVWQRFGFDFIRSKYTFHKTFDE